MFDTTPPDWAPLARIRAHEQVMAAIEERIRSRVVRPGDRLPPERRLAEALRVSRGAVREALRVLEAIGVVEAGTGSGSRAGSKIVADRSTGIALVIRLHLQLASLSPRDLMETRLCIESDAAAYAAEHASAEDLMRLRERLDDMWRSRTAEHYLALDTQSHLQMVRLSGNGLSEAIVSAIRDTERHNATVALAGLEDFDATTKDLTARLDLLVSAIAARDRNRAATLAGERIQAFYGALDWTY